MTAYSGQFGERDGGESGIERLGHIQTSELLDALEPIQYRVSVAIQGRGRFDQTSCSQVHHHRFDQAVAFRFLARSNRDENELL